MKKQMYRHILGKIYSVISSLQYVLDDKDNDDILSVLNLIDKAAFQIETILDKQNDKGFFNE